MKAAHPVPTDPPLIDIDAAELVYPNGTRALQAVTLPVPRGEFVTLIGPSGCGKSSLLKMLTGLQAPSAGRVSLCEPRPRLSYVFQEPTLMPWATVATNVRLPLDLAGTPRATAEARVREALALVGLAGVAGQRPRELSGGMQMRVSIARALVTEPTLLLMDEPFGALDEITRNALDDELLALWQRHGLTVIFVTHSLHEAVYLSQRVVVMAAGPGRIAHTLAIDEPHPRGPAWRVSQPFARYAATLQAHLQSAQQGASLSSS